ncbi:FecR domain-containing protein [Hymenobacter sp.]|uniref:FecR family protein n=1 Tax=Hymenobacter sp. TaxID=1898978 RepID=UPI00286AF84D|nr:FecR domain-containing protein [Hymenobacter sp.]
MDQLAFRALLHRYQQGECTPAEKQRVEQWYEALDNDRQLLLTAAEQAALVATLWQRIASQTALPLPDAPPPAGRAAWALHRRWAAVALLALGAGLAGTYASKKSSKWAAVWSPRSRPAAAPGWVVHANSSARAARLALPDGSTVTLAPTSSLKYPRAFAGPRRTVYLTGAAFFDVSHDARHPFLVYTDQVVTTVLGTSFRVRAFAGQPEVQVQVRTGRVRVSPRAAGPTGAVSSLEVLEVRPNQQAVYSAARRQLRRELVAQPAQLAAQSFVFDDRPVAEVLAALERAYGVAIAYDAAALRHCTLNLSLTDEPLFAKLDIICEALGATYEQADGRILFHSPSCRAE